jgi:CHAD domain-containing protein
VFLLKLGRFIDEGTFSDDQLEALILLQDEWQEEQAAADREVRRYLARGQFQALASEFERLTQTPGLGVPAGDAVPVPVKTGHVAPILIYQKLGSVRAFDDYLENATLALLHALRIQCKELRYTLEFFKPIMGPSTGQIIDTVMQLLTHLGDLNDARVALDMLKQESRTELAPAVALYREARLAELEGLVADFPERWGEFERPEWRQQLAAALAVL